MNRQRPLVASDVTGGQSHGFWKAFSREGGTFADLQEAINNVACMQNIVRIIKGPLDQKALTYCIYELLLLNAAEQGIERKDGTYRFLDPGIPLLMLRNLPLVRRENLISEQPYEAWGWDWADQAEEPQKRIFRMPVENSFNRSFGEQKNLLLPDEELPSVRCVVTFLVMNSLVNHQRLLPDTYVHCAGTTDNSMLPRYMVGRFDTTSGVYIGYTDERPSSDRAIVGSRKAA